MYNPQQTITYEPSSAISSSTDNASPAKVQALVPQHSLYAILQRLFEIIPDLISKDAVFQITTEYLANISLDSIDNLQPTITQFNEALDAANVGLIMWHLPTNRRFPTSKANSLLGLNSDDFKPGEFEKMVNLSVHPEDRHYMINTLRVALEFKGENYPAEFNYRVIWPDGSLHYLVTRGRFTHDSFVGATMDVTNLKLAELAIEEQISKRAEEAENYRHKQAEFIDTLCHELRNPLNGVFGYIEALEQHIVPLKELSDSDISFAKAFEKLKYDINILKDCADQQKSIIDDVLDLSKIDAKKIELDENIFNPKHVIEHIIAMFSPRYRAKQLVRKDELANADDYVKADEHRLRQVLINLISNAIKFTEQGSVQVRAWLVPLSNSQLSVPAQKDEINKPQSNYLECEVQDTGPGMSPEEQNNLFMAFGQANKQVSAKYGGSGLGLVICQRLVTLMGGDKIQITSEKGKGTCFRFKILCNTLTPEEKLKAQTEFKKQPINLEQPLSLNRQISVLIVEDNSVNQKILERIMKKAHYRHLIASNGSEAVQLYKKYKFDVILMDVVMPIMDGLEATRQIRTLEHEQNLPPIAIIGTSGNSSQAQKKAATDAGMTDYLIKPFLKADIIRLIAMHTASACPKSESLMGRRLLPPSPVIVPNNHGLIEVTYDAKDKKDSFDNATNMTVPGAADNKAATPVCAVNLKANASQTMVITGSSDNQINITVASDILALSSHTGAEATTSAGMTVISPNKQVSPNSMLTMQADASSPGLFFSQTQIDKKNHVEQTTLAAGAIGISDSNTSIELTVVPETNNAKIKPTTKTTNSCWYSFWDSIAKCLTSCATSIRDCRCGDCSSCHCFNSENNARIKPVTTAQS